MSTPAPTWKPAPIYKPGDVANGHRLTDGGAWEPVPRKNTRTRDAWLIGGAVLIGLAIPLAVLQLSDAMIGGLLLAVALGVCYFVPTFVAALHRTSTTGPAIIINIFLGWTIIGWVVALAMAFGGTPTERPPVRTGTPGRRGR